MRILWVDTETTGIDPLDSSIFELAAILVDNGKVLCERCFWLNPLSETIIYHEDAGKVHGYTKEQIESFTPEKEEVPIIASFFEESRELFQSDGSKRELCYIAGYNVSFDYGHIAALLDRNGYKMSDYFKPVVFDVFEQVKRAGAAKRLPYLENRKLVTVAKSLNVVHEKAHDALSDIRTTRQVAIELQKKGIPLII